MSINRLEICRDVLEKAYREKLGIAFSSSIDEIGQGRQPFWRTVSDHDLTTALEPQATGAAGLLLDPEVGLLLYILPFHVKTSLHKQVVRVLALRSQLSIERNYAGASLDKGDLRGAWRVAVHWLVPQSVSSKWTDQIEKIRRETAFSEELSMDAIFLSDDDVRTQIVRYGFPRLLITTREVFKKQRVEEITDWLSANLLVKEALVDFSAQFHQSQQRELANEIVAELKSFDLDKNPVRARVLRGPLTPRKIRKIHIRDFRNLRDVRFDFGIPPVSASIVHGPNGTGKSSLCEAISIAMFGSSFRYKWFADSTRERDVTARDRAREYLDNYLTPLDDPSAGPLIALDDQPLGRPSLLLGDQTEEADLAMAGTVLTQDTSLEFARMPSEELGARVLRGYSDLADHLESFVESRANQANEARLRFLRNLGLSGAITKIDTAYERIAKREIDQSLPAFPQALVSWLDTINELTGDVSASVARRWRSWGDDAPRDGMALQIASLRQKPTELAREISQWLNAFNELLLASGEVLKSVEMRMDPSLQDLEQVAARLAAWGEWMEHHEERPTSRSSPLAVSLTQELKTLQAKQKRVLEGGQSARAHFEHLERVETWVQESWTKLHANSCPTCGADHSDRGGILKVVETLREQTAARREELREEYLRLKIAIENVQKQLVESGLAECPLTTEEQSILTASLEWLVPQGQTLAEWIRTKASRESLLQYVAVLSQKPSLPSAADIQSDSERVGRIILSQFREAERVFEAPTNWKPLKLKLTETLAGIVKDHLPNTLARLWLELALNLTSAPWLLPDRPSFDVTTRRGEQQSTVRIKDRLARYILNQSEVHTLGLAWFFASYLTQGRFFHACMVMDDPAQELDQTSFRDLCRLWETLARLHRVYKRPLKLIIMLNQENRAVEAARATGGALYVLDWARDQERSIRKISFVGEGFYAMQPTSLFEKTG
jgi:AAA domain